MPKSIAGLSPSKMDFSNNQFTSVNIEMCGNDCAMVLCAPTTYSVLGRQPSLGEYCDHCPTAVYWGTTFCPGLSPTQQPVEQPNANDDEGPDSDISEVDTLKLLYELCGGKSWFRNESWMSSDNMCDWHGITCVPFQDSVQSIVLSGNNLVQQIPPAIFRLPNLETL